MKRMILVALLLACAGREPDNNMTVEKQMPTERVRMCQEITLQLVSGATVTDTLVLYSLTEDYTIHGERYIINNDSYVTKKRRNIPCPTTTR